MEDVGVAVEELVRDQPHCAEAEGIEHVGTAQPDVRHDAEVEDQIAADVLDPERGEVDGQQDLDPGGERGKSPFEVTVVSREEFVTPCLCLT